jgi:hypothetical protein
MNQTQAEQQVRSLLRERSYKKWLIVGISLLVIAALLGSPFFYLMIGLIKIALTLGGLAALLYAGLIAYPDLKKKYQEEIKKES